MLGRGKPFGAGQVRVARITLHLRYHENARETETVTWVHGTGRGGLDRFMRAYETEIAGLLGMPAERWKESAEIQALLASARPRGWSEPGTTYLNYTAQGGQAKLFAQLRKKTGANAHKIAPAAAKPPVRLLN